LGYVCLHQKAFSDAEVLINQALLIFGELEDIPETADTKFALNKVILERGDKDKAQNALNALLLEYRIMGYQRGVTNTLVMLSKCYQHDSDRKDLASARLREAMLIYEHLENDFEAKACRSLLGTL
jgi:hypothetical protein